MKVENYNEFVKTLLKNPQDITDEISVNNINLMHCCIGVSGEAGEILELAKKTIINGHNEDRSKFIKEMGDIEFYLEALRQHFGVSRDEVIQGNIDKLQARYDGIYSDKASIERKDTNEPT